MGYKECTHACMSCEMWRTLILNQACYIIAMMNMLLDLIECASS